LASESRAVDEKSIDSENRRKNVGVKESSIFPRKNSFQNKNVFSFQRNARMLFLAK